MSSKKKIQENEEIENKEKEEGGKKEEQKKEKHKLPTIDEHGSNNLGNEIFKALPEFDIS
tara:strand:- start:4615 stop:4794 length:180 start_codon:yes stop_codon:yes gene_type:complete